MITPEPAPSVTYWPNQASEDCTLSVFISTTEAEFSETISSIVLLDPVAEARV